MILVIGMLIAFFALGLSVSEFDRSMKQRMITAIVVIIAVTFIRGTI